MITVAVSTAIPRQIMSEKLVSVFIVRQRLLSTKKVTKKASGIEIVARKDSSPPTKRKTIKKTIRRVEIIFIARSV